VLSGAELVCSAEVMFFFETVPVVLASPFALAVFLLGLFALGIRMIFSKNQGDVEMLHAHRQREDHCDLHRWHNNNFSFFILAREKSVSRQKRHFRKNRFKRGVSNKAFHGKALQKPRLVCSLS
jgi:hypothetical protein